MACRVKPYFFPEVWITIGGLRLPGLRDRSRLGEDSREEGLDDSDRGEMGLGWRPQGESSERHMGTSSFIVDTTLLNKLQG